MTLWSAKGAKRATGGVLHSSDHWVATGVSIDSRTLQRGELFAAITDRRDGHDFIASAKNAGAVAALVSRIPEGLASDFPLLIVPDVLDGLRNLAAWRRGKYQGKVIAVTGSVGKTSTKEMLKVICSSRGATHVSPESYNNHWGVPLTLANLPMETDYAVIEIGMNNPGEIVPLAELTQPHVGLITTIAPAHLGAFDSLEAIAKEKGSLFAGFRANAVAVLNSNSVGLSIMEQLAQEAGAEVRHFGINESDQYQLLEIRFVKNGTVMKMQQGGREHCIMLNVFGAHFAENALGALTVAEALGLDPAFSALALREWRPPSGRGDCWNIQLHPERPPLRLIDDAFNANPSSVEAAIDAMSARLSVSPTSNSRAVLMLGDMLELGPDERKMHAEIANIPSLRVVDKVHCVGPLMRHLHERLGIEQRGEWCQSAEQLAAISGTIVAPGDLLLVKGSKGSRISIVADAIRKLELTPKRI